MNNTNITRLKPRKALNKAFLKVKPNRQEIEQFKANLIQLLDRTNAIESEEFHKNLVIDFLKKTYYDPNHFVNTKGRNDLVIHNGAKAKTTVGVIVEAKKPTNTAEMVKAVADDAPFVEKLAALNTKAFHELVLYYLRERITAKNLEVKQLVVTNSYEWFIFDATVFERLFAQNKVLVRQFTDFEEGRLAGTNTDFFYKQIAEPFIAQLQTDFDYTYFNLNDYKKPLRNADKKDDTKLIALYKLLSPEHLLKLPFANDSNSLDKRFYSELLHIIGLNETKQGGKKLIERNSEKAINSGSILEDAIIQLDSLDKIYRLEKPAQYGDTHKERLFNVALELSITWINRILFLKLLEAQLLTYHKGNSEKAFLNSNKVKDYDDLNRLFFQVLAKKHDARNTDVKEAFKHVPYLNSSLFEPTEIEQTTLLISNLSNDKTLPILPGTVLKDVNGKKRTGRMKTLDYLFAFLNAYDFSSEGSENIQEDNKTLINASVLGLIFEKINGYKDGSFFTPGFITMYMCRETIRKAVVQKFNDTKGWQCSDLDAIYDKIEDRAEANTIVNSIKICDPAVGSGHFLVSALNEIIAVKNDLKILQDRQGRRLKEYVAEVVNDELIITDEEGELFDYNPNNAESQRVQETLFHEKQTLIENCLFGVDINPNSVKICRLRLWIELLKNAYYIKHVENSSPEKGRWPKAGGVKFNNLPYLKTFRKNLRNNLTPAEAKLWTLLKGKGLEGRKFRRQHSFANYILDFYCPEERLAIELDGQGHFEATQAEYDRERDLFLEYSGIRVLRFENKWVWNNPGGLLEEVKNYFGKQPARSGDKSDLKDQQPPRPGDTLDLIDKQPPRPTDTPPLKGGERELVELQTLPNIDINIKCGNSLISRFSIDASLSKALRKSKFTIDSYRVAVSTYRNAQNKEEKHEMERLIAGIKSDFETTIETPFIKKLSKARGAVEKLATEINTRHQWGEATKALTKDLDKASKKLKTLEATRTEVENNKVFENAFEWRFEFPEVLNEKGDFVGFDVVIGNPPYIRQEELGDIKPYLQEHYKIYAGTADLYVYFVERALTIMRIGAAFSYIIPNKWMRAGYGSALRSFLQEQRLTEIIDFGDLPVFEEATTYPCIMQMEKAAVANVFRAATVTALNYADGLDFSHHLSRFEVLAGELRTEGWSLVPKDVQQLLAKIRSKGVPLSEYVEGKIYYGIKTGLNEAFVIDQATRDRLIAEDVRSEEVIKPFLAGRDIKRYKQPESDNYILFIPWHFPLHKDESVYGASKEAELEFEKRFPSVYNHLLKFKGKLEKRNKAETGVRYEWYALQRCAATYYEEFDKPKIIIPAIAKSANYAYDTKGNYGNDKTTIIPLSDFNLLGQLNSKLVDFYFKSIASTKQNGYFEYKPVYINQLPILPDFHPVISGGAEDLLSAYANGDRETIELLEFGNDRDMYELYGLTEDEIFLIEHADSVIFNR
ncbi:DUF559 domain-containing protein [Cryomorpha ignava]|uniref:site-specific DNA-methyltransferase (adenine-specific) n=1 Tax=Cryomorpha ignava TaxID=101383 RepID=A0A7K3WSR8_9FLAO|nr:DUF559 domain-containing protein [Cryomorpha ignava]NEN24737.1 DUF559 domain-containing protein [Cryomorpha ignava]